MACSNFKEKLSPVIEVVGKKSCWRRYIPKLGLFLNKSNVILFLEKWKNVGLFFTNFSKEIRFIYQNDYSCSFDYIYKYFIFL